MNFFRKLLEKPDLVIALSTVAYTIFTAILALIAYRSNRLTRKIVATTRKPTIIPHVTVENNKSLFIELENKSNFIVNDLFFKIKSPKKKTKNISILPYTKSRFYIEEIQKVANKPKLNIRIKFRNEEGNRFKNIYNIDIPVTERTE